MEEGSRMMKESVGKLIGRREVLQTAAAALGAASMVDGEFDDTFKRGAGRGNERLRTVAAPHYICLKTIKEKRGVLCV